MTQPTLKSGFDRPNCGTGPAPADRQGGRPGMQVRRKPFLEQVFD